ncbi:MAG: hypothetical protein O3C40_12565 [Planctomycetota bacterium]|nr:hypothetical protein [Planctomycetota bacterium]
MASCPQTDLNVVDSDDETCVDTYTKVMRNDTLFSGRKVGCELWQFLTTEGIERIQKEYWIGFAEHPPHELSLQITITTGVEDAVESDPEDEPEIDL